MDEITLEEKRIHYLDTAKVIAVFLVVFAHLFSTYSAERVFIYSFHVPFFFLVSGLFHKWKGKVQWKKYILMLFVNVLGANVLYVFLGGGFYQLGLWTWTPSGFSIADTIFRTWYNMFKCFLLGVVFTRDLPNGVTWFLIALFYSKLGTDILQKYPKYRFIILLLILLLIPLSLFVKLPLWLCQGAIAFSFYIIGFKFKDKILAFVDGCKCKWLIVVVLLGINVLLTLLNGKVSLAVLLFGRLLRPCNLLVFYINALVGTLMLILLSSYYNKANTIITSVSKSLMPILVLQQFFLTTIRSIAGGSLTNIALATLLSIAIIAICVFLNKMVDYVKIPR